MKRVAMLILTGTCLTSSLFSQSVDLFGYFESQFMMARIKSETIQLQSNKLRVDIEASRNNVHFGANINAITYHGKTEWAIPDYLPKKVVQEIPIALRPYYMLPFEDDMVLDNAFLKFSFSKWDLTLGKQQISLGAGYAWNPTDVFNQKDLFDPTYEQPGHNAIRIDYALADRINCLVLYSPAETWNQSTKLFSIKTGLGRFDYTLLAIEKKWGFHDYLAFSGLDFFETNEKRQIVGGSVVGECLGVGVWMEGGYNHMEISENFSEIVTGFNYTFDFETFIMLEYYHNSMAKSKAADYRFNDWMRYLTSEQKALNQDQLYIMIQHPVSDLTQIGFSALAAGDGSMALLPTLTSSLFENVELMAYGNFYMGKENSMFNKNLGNGGLIRLRVYF